MSLRLRQAIPGAPNVDSPSCLDVISTAGKALIVFASGSNVQLVGPELELVHTLQFWSALPHRAASTSTAQVEGVLCSSKDGLILAWSGPHVVIWTYRTARQTAGWEVHSSLVASAEVTCLDFHSGSLVLGTREGLEYWRTDLLADVTVWDRLWDRQVSHLSPRASIDGIRKYPAPSMVCLSPLTGHVAWSQGQRSVWILEVKGKGGAVGIPQELRHPKDVEWISWRKPSPSSGDAHLYTLTRKSILRIYSPVLDDPTWFQLQATLDHRSFTPVGKGQKSHAGEGSLIVLDADVVRRCVAAERTQELSKSVSGVVKKAFEALGSEEADMVGCLKDDGSLSFRSIVNMDRKPPTLLKSLPLCRTRLPGTNSIPLSIRAKILHLPETAKLLFINPPSAGTRISGYRFSLLDGLASSAAALSPLVVSESATSALSLNRPLKHFARSPNGRGLLAIAEGEMTVWQKEKLGKIPSRAQPVPALTPRCQWKTDESLRDAAIFAKGRAILCYHHGDNPNITLQHLSEGRSAPTPALELPDLDLRPGDRLEVIQGFSDIDDGYSPASQTSSRAIALAASKQGEAWVWTIESASGGNPPKIKLDSRFRLPTAGPMSHILPVDPMAWHQSAIDWENDTPLQDMILTVTDAGVLEFWCPRFGQHLATEDCKQHAHGIEPWYRTGEVRTGRASTTIVRCSSRKKVVLVSPLEDGTIEVTIWDSKVSEFSTGLELTKVFQADEGLQDLDWTTTSDLQSVLAVGFPHRVELLCEQRLSDSETNPGWASVITIDLTRYTPNPISDSIWLAGGSLAVGTENQVYLFSRFLDRDSPVPSPRASAKSVVITDEPEDIFQLVALQNGPLWDYHPTLLAQSLVWNKLDLVVNILARLLNAFEAADLEEHRAIRWTRLDPEVFTIKSKAPVVVKEDGNRYDSLFKSAPIAETDDRDKFVAAHVARLVGFLDGPIRLPLSQAEKSSVATIAQAVLEVERQRRSLDTCGLRYLLSVRMLANQKRLASSGTSTPAQTSPRGLGASRLSFRNIVWASHSESQDVLLTAAAESCRDGRMTWEDAKRLGVFLWLKSSETVKSQLETIARNRFMADEARDPTSCSLIFFALGKKKVVHGLWRQAPGHKEQQLMLRFLANDFELERWKTAAMKNAYALLSKQRFEYAAAFFLLAGSPKDAINLIVRQLDDWQLAIAIARVVEERTDGPLMQWILSDTVLPRAFAGGHRWLATWAFWQIGRRDLAVRIIISPMTEIARVWQPANGLSVGDPENDDPSLLLLFQHLKSKSLQTAKGTNEIPEKLEFDFVLHNAKMFFRMGCHPLALDLLRSWSFDRPFFPVRQTRSSKSSTPGLFDSRSLERPALSPSATRRRPSFMLSTGRRETMIMDIDPMAEQSEPVTRLPSPEPIPNGKTAATGPPNGSEDVSKDKGIGAGPGESTDAPKKVGNLMKELKQDVQQGAMEFNMDSFF